MLIVCSAVAKRAKVIFGTRCHLIHHVIYHLIYPICLVDICLVDIGYRRFGVPSGTLPITIPTVGGSATIRGNPNIIATNCLIRNKQRCYCLDLVVRPNSSKKPIMYLLVFIAGLFLWSPFAIAAPSVEVKVTGIDDALYDNVMLTLDIERQKSHESLNEARIRLLHEKSQQQIKAALKPFGYYQSVINSKLEQQSADQWLAVYTVAAGPPIPIRLFDFQLIGEAQRDAWFDKLKKNLPLSAGQTLNQPLYERIKQDLISTASERGYFDARLVANKVTIDLDSYSASVVLHFDSGVRYQFGPVTFSEEVLKPSLMQRYVPFQQGDPYTVDALLDLQQSLVDSSFFNKVDVKTVRDAAQQGVIPVVVTVEPRKRHKYTLGAGYGTDTGARGKLGWEMPRINKYGHRFSSELKISEISDSLLGKYHIPIKNPRTDEIVFQAGYNKDTTDVSESYTRFAGVSLSQARGLWRETWSVRFESERFRIADETSDANLLIPGVNWTRIWAKDRIYIKKGVRLDLSFRGAEEQLFSDMSFFQGSTIIKSIVPLGSRARMIAQGQLAGSILSDFATLPSSSRFFAGGAQSVRGYRYQSLGPRNDNGDVIGGRHLFTTSLEFEHEIVNKWSGAVFVDIGNAINTVNDPLEQGAGFGVRWRSPIGPVRLDLASAISQEGKPWRFHINIGPDL